MQSDIINRRLAKFIWAALIFFAWSLILGAIISQEPVRLFIQSGPGHIISIVHTHLGLMGWLSLMLMASIYYLMPIFSGKSIVGPKLIEWIFWIWVVCLAGCGVLMIIAGVVGGQAFADGVRGTALKNIVLPYAMPGSILCVICVIAGLMFVVQIFVSLSRGSKVA
jgi:cbb3-type cytochrome oxidase subunit 1